MHLEARLGCGEGLVRVKVRVSVRVRVRVKVRVRVRVRVGVRVPGSPIGRGARVAPSPGCC